MLRATTRTVLLDHTAASSSMKRVDDARSLARAPCPVHRDADEGGCPRRQVRRIPGHLRGELALPDRQGGRAAEQRRCGLGQYVEPQRLDLDLPVEAVDADLREG